MNVKRREQLFPIIINGQNVVSGSNNNTFRYSFPAGSVRFENSKVAIASINMYYSWFNITSAYGNNTFSYVFPTLAGSTQINLTIPDGNYTIGDLNNYLQASFIEEGFYLVDGDGNYIYYLEIVENPTFYAIQLNSYPVPTSLPSGYSNPASMTFPATTATPQLIVNDNPFTSVIGFNNGTYPSVFQTITYSKTSDFVPQVSPVQSLILTSNLVNNRYSNPSTVLYSFSPAGVSFGSLIQSSPAELSFIDIQDGNYSDFTIQFLDQEFNQLVVNDANIVVQLLIQNEEIVY